MSVDIDANPDKAWVSMSFQFIPPPNPPFPEPMKRRFHSSGRKRPKLKEEVGEDITFTVIAHRAGSPVAGLGKGGEVWSQVPFAVMGMAVVIFA